MISKIQCKFPLWHIIHSNIEPNLDKFRYMGLIKAKDSDYSAHAQIPDVLQIRPYPLDIAREMSSCKLVDRQGH